MHVVCAAAIWPLKGLQKSVSATKRDASVGFCSNSCGPQSFRQRQKQTPK